MSHKRQAYTLMEILAIIMAMVVIIALSAKPMRALVSDIPRSGRDHEVWIKTTNMLEQLKADVEQSTRIRMFQMDPRISENLLYLEQPDGLISYAITNNQVIRQSGILADHREDVWELPHVHIQWSLWENNKMPYALEITTWTQRIVLGQTQKKFNQSYVYFQQTGSINP